MCTVCKSVVLDDQSELWLEDDEELEWPEKDLLTSAREKQSRYVSRY